MVDLHEGLSFRGQPFLLKETAMTERKIELKSITLETKPMTFYEFWHWESINRPFRNAHQVY